MPFPFIILGLGLLGLWGLSEYKNKRIKTKQDLLKRYTIDEYLSVREIENKKKVEIQQHDFQLSEIVREIQDYRLDNKQYVLKLANKHLYLCMPVNYLNDYILFKNKEEQESITTIEDIIDEAFYSATIEGAHSSRKRFEELINTRQKPMNISEKMIINNYNAIQSLESYKSRPLDYDLICLIHKTVTQGTLDKSVDEGRFRDDVVEITNSSGKVIFTPVQNIKTMYSMLNNLLAWVNAPSDKHEENLLKVIVFHFTFGYIHPFFDGNGRTVRILSMLLLLKYNLDYLAYLPIAKYIEQYRKEYEQAFLNAEWSDQNSYELDITYFVSYISKMYSLAMFDKKDIIKNKVVSGLRLELIRKIEQNNIALTPRQMTILDLIIKEQLDGIRVQDIADTMNYSYTTVSKDINYLLGFGLISYTIYGKTRYFNINIG